MTIVDDQIAAEIASLAQVVPVPDANSLGYGVDLSCVTDITPDLAEVDPESAQGIGEMAVRFLTVERDSVPDAPGRGYNIFRLLLAGSSVDVINNAQTAISNEVEQDDRIASSTTVVVVTGLKQLSITISIVPQDPTLGPFDLVLAVSDGVVLFDLVSQQ